MSEFTFILLIHVTMHQRVVFLPSFYSAGQSMWVLDVLVCDKLTSQTLHRNSAEVLFEWEDLDRNPLSNWNLLSRHKRSRIKNRHHIQDTRKSLGFGLNSLNNHFLNSTLFEINKIKAYFKTYIWNNFTEPQLLPTSNGPHQWFGNNWDFNDHLKLILY